MIIVDFVESLQYVVLPWGNFTHSLRLDLWSDQTCFSPLTSLKAGPLRCGALQPHTIQYLMLGVWEIFAIKGKGATATATSCNLTDRRTATGNVAGPPQHWPGNHIDLQGPQASQPTEVTLVT